MGGAIGAVIFLVWKFGAKGGGGGGGGAGAIMVGGDGVKVDLETSVVVIEVGEGEEKLSDSAELKFWRFPSKVESPVGKKIFDWSTISRRSITTGKSEAIRAFVNASLYWPRWIIRRS